VFAVINGRQAGGIAGYVGTNGKVENCAALNPSIIAATGTSPVAKRVASTKSATSSTLTNNAAFSGMTLNGSAVASSDATDLDGADISKAQIAADGTIGGRFTAANGWTVQNGKLPGFGAAVDLPAHLEQ